MTDITRISILENLDLDLEWDNHDYTGMDPELNQKILEECGRRTLVLCGSSEAGVMEGASYLTIDTEYDQEMSVGQKELFLLLCELQKTTVYSVTIINKLKETLKLKDPFSIVQRLENLQSIGAISGFKF